ncbi:MAG: hypothetical protein RMJ98_16865 [Myxococcales bacterium]|nr:hypothetical protein [Polyangiaceae bacterium]MDW8250968.1 hypothetical protein [Myxococcales bacterium]
MKLHPLAWSLALCVALPAFASAPSAPASAPMPAASASASASASAKRSDFGVASDPPPLVTRKKWVYELVYYEGALFAPTPRQRDAGRPTETPRKMGRFAIELYNGPDLVERVRFELPMLNGDPFTNKPRPWNAPPDMERRVRVRVQVEVPMTDRANRAIFVDRATGHRVRLPWPVQPPSP